jgi:hypothetical protein
MTTLTLDSTNQTLATAGIKLRLSHKGLAAVSKVATFAKALEFCIKNTQARHDVISILVHYKDQPDMVFEAERPMGQPMLDAAPAHNNMDSPPPRQQRPVAQSEPVQQSTDNQSAPARTMSHPNAPEAELQEPASGQQPDSEKRNFVGHHVYGRQSALYFAYDETRGGDATIAVDGAMSVATRQYNWNQKLRIQITRSDLPSVAAVMFGLLPKVELSNYGADNTKRLLIENQGKNYFLNRSAKDHHQIAVPISASDVYEIRSLFLAQLMKNRPEIGVEGVLTNLKCHAAMLKQGVQ